jgi:hypothetical protein
VTRELAGDCCLLIAQKLGECRQRCHQLVSIVL